MSYLECLKQRTDGVVPVEFVVKPTEPDWTAPVAVLRDAVAASFNGVCPSTAAAAAPLALALVDM